MALEKMINARFALKIDTYANWTSETLGEGKGALCVLKHGEVGFCEIPSGNTAATTAPTILFKVGDGTSPFKSLKWASALAADVYGWAKAETVVLEGQKLVFKNKDNSTAHEVDLSGFVTDGELADILAGYKTKQDAKNFAGSTVKTVTNVTQNANGEVDVTYENIAFPAATVVGVDDEAVENEFVTAISLDENGNVVATRKVIEEADITDALADFGLTKTDYGIEAGQYTAHGFNAKTYINVGSVETSGQYGAISFANGKIQANGGAIATEGYADKAAADVKDYADDTFATKVALGEEATTRANADQAIRDDMATALALKADKTYVDETFATKTALEAEVTRATGVEGGLRTDVDAVTARVNTFLEGTGAADVIDTLEDLINYINTHDDIEISSILAAIQALENKTILGTYADGEETKEYATVKAYVEAVVAALEKKITDAEGGYAAADAALKAELQKEIDDDVAAEAALRDSADVELGKRIDAEAKTREDADKALGERIDAIVDEETGVLAVAKKYTDDEIVALALGDMSKETAADYVKKADAPGYTDILTKTEGAATYRTEAQVNTQIDAKIGALGTAVQNVAAVAGNGIKVTREGNNVSLDWDTDVVFVFNAGSSTTVI